ncbi:MAG: hypothetical protein K2K74_19550 [Lachnospiraceae bacterium]|nr:hypothetical protein [Lachnospiraceae bacterium]
MGISAVAGFSGFGSYRISSIHGNPYSMDAIQKIGQNNGRSGKPLVIASEEKEDLYVKDYGELDTPKSTASGDFAEMLGIQERMLAKTDEGRQTNTNYASYLNDTIGMMGLQNRLRDQLNGAGFTPFL